MKFYPVFGPHGDYSGPDRANVYYTRTHAHTHSSITHLMTANSKSANKTICSLFFFISAMVKSAHYTKYVFIKHM